MIDLSYHKPEQETENEIGTVIAVMAPILAVLIVLMERML